MDSGSEIALNQLNRGVEATGNYVKEKLGKKTVPAGIAQNISKYFSHCESNKILNVDEHIRDRCHIHLDPEVAIVRIIEHQMNISSVP